MAVTDAEMADFEATMDAFYNMHGPQKCDCHEKLWAQKGIVTIRYSVKCEGNSMLELTRQYENGQRI